MPQHTFFSKLRPKSKSKSKHGQVAEDTDADRNGGHTLISPPLQSQPAGPVRESGGDAPPGRTSDGKSHDYDGDGDDATAALKKHPEAAEEEEEEGEGEGEGEEGGEGEEHPEKNERSIERAGSDESTILLDDGNEEEASIQDGGKRGLTIVSNPFSGASARPAEGAAATLGGSNTLTKTPTWADVKHSAIEPSLQALLLSWVMEVGRSDHGAGTAFAMNNHARLGTLIFNAALQEYLISHDENEPDENGGMVSQCSFSLALECSELYIALS